MNSHLSMVSKYRAQRCACNGDVCGPQSLMYLLPSPSQKAELWRAPVLRWVYTVIQSIIGASSNKSSWLLWIIEIGLFEAYNVYREERKQYNHVISPLFVFPSFSRTDMLGNRATTNMAELLNLRIEVTIL